MYEVEKQDGNLLFVKNENNQTAIVETNCTIELQGKKFESGGLVVDEKYITAYWGDDKNIVTTWSGKPISQISRNEEDGKIVILNTVKKMGTKFHYISFWYNGYRYSGTSRGNGWILNARKTKDKSD